MKRFFLFLFLFVVCFSLTGCGFGKKFDNTISEVHENLFACEDENFFITLSLGKRENPYIVDGKSNELVDFAVLTAYKQNINFQNDKVEFKLTTNAKLYEGVFEINPFDESYVVDLIKIETDFTGLNLEIIADNTSYSYNLINQLLGTDATADEVKEIAKLQFSEIESRISQNKQIKAETYIRLIKRKGYKPLWYVSLICENDEMFALIIEPSTKDVIAKNFK